MRAHGLWPVGCFVKMFCEDDRYEENNVSMKMRMRVSELYDDFLLRFNSKLILKNERGSMNDITLE